MSWELVFDLKDQGFPAWGTFWFLSVLFAMGVFIWVFHQKLELLNAKLREFAPAVVGRALDSVRWAQPSERLVGILFVFVSIFLTSVFGLLVYGKYMSLERAYDEMTYSVVEGIVGDFRPASLCADGEWSASTSATPDENEPTTESFVIGNEKFVYADNYMNTAFRTTSACGGPIREGLYARAWHHEGVIIRLEIRK